MSHITTQTTPLRSEGLERQLKVLFLFLGTGFVGASVAGLLDGATQYALLGTGAVMFAVVLGMTFLRWYPSSGGEAVASYIEKDGVPCFVVDDEGVILAKNSAASVGFEPKEDETLATAMRSIFANPSAVLFRLQCKAKIDGNAREDVVTKVGQSRISVHVLEDKKYLWRLEALTERNGSGRSLDTLPVPMLTVGRSGAVLFMNEAALKLVGRRVKSLDRLFFTKDLATGSLQTLTTEQGPIQVTLVLGATSSVRREYYMFPVENVKTSVDVEKNAPDLGADFSTLPVAMIKIAPSGKILEINQMAAEFLGHRAETGMELGVVMQGLGRPIADWLGDVAFGRKGQSSEFLRLTRKDKEVFAQVTLSRVTDCELIAVLNDATELKTLEAQFVQSQKMQAIGQLAGGVAHDFNNLLTAISGHCDLLLLRHDQGDQDFGDLVQINQNANRAAALVSQLLAFSRKQTLRLETLDLRDTLSDLTHLLNRLVGEKITLTLSHDPILKSIRADKRQLEQVLMNLVVNARDAMPQGGEIRIETEVVILDEPLERDRAVLAAGEYVNVKVLDEGVGIEPDKLQKIFEPFYTTKRTGEGTGLGLSTAYGIIKQTGGFIFVDSILGKGTEFNLFFPTHEVKTSTKVTSKIVRETNFSEKAEGVVLLVEDEAPVRAFASRALRLRGYTVLEAESAEEALKTLEDANLLVDVFVTDVVMPGLDGPTWVRQALKDRPQVRVVFVSGYAEGAFDESSQKIPNSVFLPKPFSLSQLTETVHQQLH